MQDLGQKELQIKGHPRTDNSALLLSLVLNGVGVARIDDLFALPLVRQGRQAPRLHDQFVSPRVPVFAVLLQERQRLPKIRAGIDYWAQWLAEPEQAVSTEPIASIAHIGYASAPTAGAGRA